MALTGELSDLSLAELIEFFCNQRKTGCLKVNYPAGAGYFYLRAGAVIHARFGDLKGIDAVYYALTQANASFTFHSSTGAPEHSINQPWTSVVLEGLRRMDEGVIPPQPSPASLAAEADAVEKSAPAKVSAVSGGAEKPLTKPTTSTQDVKAFGVLLSSTENNSFASRRRSPAMVVAAVFLLVAVVGIPWALYKRKQQPAASNGVSAASTVVPMPSAAAANPEMPAAEATPEAQTAEGDAAELARRQREARARERAREQEAKTDAAAKAASTSGPTSRKTATVQVSYDENGRVTAASGGDATALRIARQKRFPPGKPGSATITIPIN